MTMAFLLILTALLVLMAVIALAGPRLGLLSLPFLSACVLGTWLVPQLMAAESDARIPDTGMDAFLVFVLLALAATGAGWCMRPPSAGVHWCLPSVIDGNLTRIRMAAALATALALAIQAAILMQDPEVLASSQPSGFITILRMLATLNPVALFLATVVLLRRADMMAIFIFLAAVSAFGLELVLQIKRTSVFEVVLVLCLGAYAGRQILPKRRLVLGSLPLGFIFINLVHEVRRTSGFRVSESGEREVVWPTLSRLSDMDWIAAAGLRAQSSYFEVTNAALTFQSLLVSEAFGWGRHFWNQAVFRWVPGQFVGADVKAALMFDMTSTIEILDTAGLDWKLGTTVTGFTSPFADFAVFGCLVFMLNAFLVAGVLRRGLNGSMPDLAVAVPVISAAIVSFTHDGYALLMAWPLVMLARHGVAVLLDGRPMKTIIRARGLAT